MDFLKKYWVYIILPAFTALGVGVFLLVAGKDAVPVPPGTPPVEPLPPVGFPTVPPGTPPPPAAPPSASPVNNPATLSTEKKYAETSDEDIKKLFDAMRKKP